MPRDIREIAADFDALTAYDFDYANPRASGWERLDQLCDEMQTVNDPGACVPVLLRTMERLDGAELGSPGPLVHAMETWRGGYEELLAQSVRRKPTALSVWMVNRILNSDPPDAEAWMVLLRNVAHNPAASEVTKLEAEGFIVFQTNRRSAKKDDA